jgi:hypothetical protein
MDAAGIYERLKRSVDEADTSNADRREWLRLSALVLEHLLKLQLVAVEQQRGFVQRVRSLEAADARQFQTDTKDLRFHIDQLTALYVRCNARLE